MCPCVWPQVLFQVALMILKFLEAPMLGCRDEAEAIKILNDFLANIGKKAAQEYKVQQEEETVKVWGGGGREGVRERRRGGKESDGGREGGRKGVRE